MKLLPILALLALLPCLAEEAPPPPPDKALVDLISTQAIEPISKRQLGVGAFSRVRLAEPEMEWGSDLGNGLHSFTIYHGNDRALPGLVRAKDKKVFLLETNELRYVAAADHPLLKEQPATPAPPAAP